MPLLSVAQDEDVWILKGLRNGYMHFSSMYQLPRADSARGNPQLRMRAIHISPGRSDVMIQEM